MVGFFSLFTTHHSGWLVLNLQNAETGCLTRIQGSGTFTMAYLIRPTQTILYIICLG
jgi:hypothetical protein